MTSPGHVTLRRQGGSALRTLLGVAGLGLAVWLLVVFVGWLMRSDAARLSETIDDARDALVEGRDEEFLAYFEPELVYRGRHDFRKLEYDLQRWRQVNLSQVHIADRTIEVVGDTAEVKLVVVAGSGLIDLGRVDVRITAGKDAGGSWRVRAFDWQR